MHYYEQITIIDPNLDDTAIEATVQRIKDVIIKQGGEIIKAENWGRRKLAYELNKYQKGCYIFLLFKSPPSTIVELEKLGKVVDAIIKFMVVRLIKKKQIEAIIASASRAAEKDTPEAVEGSEVKAAESVEAAPKPEEKGPEEKENV